MSETFIKLQVRITAVLLILFLALASHSAAASEIDGAAASPEKPPEKPAFSVEEAENIAGFVPILRLGFAKTPEAASYASVCPDVRMQNRNDFDFNAMERRLICGDERSDLIGQSWAKIPPNQAAYFMQAFLQSRGYHQSVFIQDGLVLFIHPGPLSRLKSFKILGGEPGWNPPRRRLIHGLALTPGLLDDLQDWTLTQLKTDAYACATAESEADPETGEAIVRVESGQQMRIGAIEDTRDTGLRDGVLNRYNAFRVGDLYDENLVRLTRSRTEEDGFLQTLLLTSRCESDHVVIVRDATLGPSRTIRVGLGGNADQGAKLRAELRQNRIGSSASTIRAVVNFTYLREMVNSQSVDTKFRWYYARGEARSYLEPRIIYENRAEQSFASQSIIVRGVHGWGKEFRRGGLTVEAGPNWLQSNTLRGVGAAETFLVFGEFIGRWLNHDFEVHATSPRSGESLEGSVIATQPNLGADFTAQRIQLTGRKLWNIHRFDPPLLILGTRFNLSSVFSPDDNLRSNLPIQFLTFLGGEQDLRGFGRQTLPRSGSGALSGATASFEARLHRIIIRRIDVFSFIDAGAFGGQDFDLQTPIFMSPGLGLRWESPFGSLRGYVAQRFALLEDPAEPPYFREWRLGFTFGEEF